MSLYSLSDASRILRVSPSRLRAWSRTELVSARAAQAQSFAFEDLVRLRAIAGLVARGVSVRRIRTTLARLQERMPELREPVAALRMWGDNARRVVARDGDALVEADGQLLLDFDAQHVAPEVAAITPAGEEPRPLTAFEWFERGCMLDAQAGKSAEALTAYRHALDLSPDFADAWCNLGTVHFQRSERAEAKRCYEGALAADADHLEANFNLANLLDDEGRRETALHHYKAAVRVDASFPDARLNLALLYDRLGLRRLGREQWRAYLQLVPTGSWADLARERVGEVDG
ncbi:MAG: tetratricopeptide repeat protein [Deltaproteobacteria bacterium]|nr:tetratricopeptide repeat protein [Deltaproteobacteria bacterium]